MESTREGGFEKKNAVLLDPCIAGCGVFIELGNKGRTTILNFYIHKLFHFA